jgi:predicted nicotinamide N-methyase
MKVDDFLEEITSEDISSHIHELYSHPKSQDLGIQSRSSCVNVAIGSEDYQFKQSLTSLNSKGSTTGYVLWKVSVPFLKWILECPLYDFRDKVVMELGSGVTGLFASLLTHKSKHFIASDHQHALLKLLKENIQSNLVDAESSTVHISHNARRNKGRVDVIEYDWEDLDNGQWSLKQVHEGTLDFIIGCDIVYNDYLIPHLVNALVQLCGSDTVIIIGLQLRLPENIEQFVEELLSRGFRVWRHLGECLGDELTEGFVVYYIRRA